MQLTLGGQYSRKDVHSIFSPHTVFTPQAGTWGLHGIVPVPDRNGDFVFFVTLGQQQGDHVFDEGISSEGVLSWQSQPRQALNNSQIQQFIAHDESVNNIYLFLRTDKRGPYKHFGRLGYLTHDASRENPVYFQWQLLDWDELDGAQLEVPDNTSIGESPIVVADQSNILTHSKRPTSAGSRAAVDTPTFRSRKVADYSMRDERNRKLGLQGEELVLMEEKRRLLELGLHELSEAVTHTSVIEGDGAGYDIKSFNDDGSPRFIEVKTTRGGADTDFFMSVNEIRFADQHPDSYCLYRLYNFDVATNSAECYVHMGAIDDSTFNKKPINFRVSLA